MANVEVKMDCVNLPLWDALMYILIKELREEGRGGVVVGEKSNEGQFLRKWTGIYSSRPGKGSWEVG